MKSSFVVSLLLILSSCAVGWLHFHAPNQQTYLQTWPKPIYALNLPADSNLVELGRHLFYDPILSRDSSISCSSCHLQYTGFAHVDHALSHGIDSRIGARNAPTLVNLAWMPIMHWDGGVKHIDLQPLNPITHPLEMDNTLEEVLKRLNRSKKYQQLARNAAGSVEIGSVVLFKSLRYFLLSLISADAKYDAVMRGLHEQFTEQELSGYKLFKRHCVSCHQEPLLTDNTLRSNGIAPDQTNPDKGAYSITLNASDLYRFKVPTLRNIAFTFPYMHDGRYAKLKDVINFYSDSASAFRLQYADLKLKQPFNFSATEKKDLLAFLYTLTDKTFLFNPKFGYPQP